MGEHVHIGSYHKKPPRLLELFGNSVKIYSECLNDFFHLLMEKLKYFKTAVLWNRMTIMYMYKQCTSRQPCRGELKSVHREILLPVFLNIVHMY